MKKESSMVGGEKTILPEHIPVNPDLTSEMLIDVVVNKDSRVWVFHDRPFPGYLEWAEYDAGEGKLVFVTKGGRINDFGIQIEPLMDKYLKKAAYIEAYLVKDRVFHDYIRTQLIVRNNTH